MYSCVAHVSAWGDRGMRFRLGLSGCELRLVIRLLRRLEKSRLGRPSATSDRFVSPAKVDWAGPTTFVDSIPTSRDQIMPPNWDARSVKAAKIGVMFRFMEVTILECRQLNATRQRNSQNASGNFCVRTGSKPNNFEKPPQIGESGNSRVPESTHFEPRAMGS